MRIDSSLRHTQYRKMELVVVALIGVRAKFLGARLSAIQARVHVTTSWISGTDPIMIYKNSYTRKQKCVSSLCMYM